MILMIINHQSEQIVNIHAVITIPHSIVPDEYS